MTTRDRLVVSVVLGVVLLGAFFMLVLKPKRQEASQLAQQVETAQARVQTAQADVSAGRAARSSYATNYATVARLGKAVPTDDDIPSLVYQLDSTAESTGVDFRSVKLTSGAGSGVAAPPNAAAAAAATSDQAGGEDGEKKDDPAAQATGTTAAPAAATQTATAALPPGAVVGQAGLNTMPFTFAFEGSFFKLSDFLTKLERYIKPTRTSVKVRGRLLLVDGLSLTAASGGFPKMKASIAATAYLLPPDQGMFDGATPQGPSATSGQPVSTTSSGGPPTAPATVTP